MKKERNSKLGYAKNGWLYKEKTAGYIFSAPFIFGFLFFVIVPVATSLYYAFCNYNILKPARWVGLKNFVDIFQDPTFYKALGVTLKFAFISVPLKLVFALIVALILLKGTKLTPFYRAAYYLPSILGSSVAVAILWKRMFAVDGLVNKLLGIQFAWLGSTTAALWVIILLAVWQFGSSMLIFLSAMKQIPRNFMRRRAWTAPAVFTPSSASRCRCLRPRSSSTSSCSSSTALWCLPRGRSSQTGNP